MRLARLALVSLIACAGTPSAPTPRAGVEQRTAAPDASAGAHTSGTPFALCVNLAVSPCVNLDCPACPAESAKDEEAAKARSSLAPLAAFVSGTSVQTNEGRATGRYDDPQGSAAPRGPACRATCARCASERARCGPAPEDEVSKPR